jgi:hypothetical protein
MIGGARHSVRADLGFNKEPMNRIRFRLLGFLVSLFNEPRPKPPVAPYLPRRRISVLELQRTGINLFSN